jgi:hypothetical protein
VAQPVSLWLDPGLRRDDEFERVTAAPAPPGICANAFIDLD